MARSKEKIEVVKEFYETFERLNANEDFIKFKKGVVEPELDRLREKILNNGTVRTKEGQFDNAVDVLMYQKMDNMFNVFFKVAEQQAGMIRKIIGKRKRKKEQEKE